ncbi:unnamed protein product, partial [Thlaspi arvense]
YLRQHFKAGENVLLIPIHSRSKNFPNLRNQLSSDGKYESRLFSSGGYNWRMVIYPKGNDNDFGIGFISMYVEIDTTSLTSKQPSEVFADLRFFVYNKKENKYFTIQDVESKSFNALRRVWGFPQVLSLDTFSDPINGYIFGDECEFGVDVIVAPSPTNWEVLSFDDKPSYPKFSWTLKNFSDLKDTFYKSSTTYWYKSKLGWGFSQFVSVAELPKAYLDKESMRRKFLDYIFSY